MKDGSGRRPSSRRSLVLGPALRPQRPPKFWLRNTPLRSIPQLQHLRFSFSMISPSNSSKKPSTSSSFCLLGVRKCRGAPRGIESNNRHTLFSWSPRVPFVRSRRHEAGRARDYPRGPHVSIGRAPSPPSSTFAARGAALHGHRPRFSFSMISPSNSVEERVPRLSAMGGRAGCNPDSPLRLATEDR